MPDRCFFHFFYLRLLSGGLFFKVLKLVSCLLNPIVFTREGHHMKASLWWQYGPSMLKKLLLVFVFLNLFNSIVEKVVNFPCWKDDFSRISMQWIWCGSRIRKALCYIPMFEFSLCGILHKVFISSPSLSFVSHILFRIGQRALWN